MFLSWFVEYGIGYLLSSLVLAWTVVSFFLLNNANKKNSKELLKLRTKEELIIEREKKVINESFLAQKEIITRLNEIYVDIDNAFSHLNGEHKFDKDSFDKYVAMEFTKKYIKPTVIKGAELLSEIKKLEYLLPEDIMQLTSKLMVQIIKSLALVVTLTNKLNNISEEEKHIINEHLEELKQVKNEIISVLWV